MNACNIIVLYGILMFLIFVRAGARAIPDFYNDKDLDAWHKFGLRSFYGPWNVIARKPNGDFVSYADYGARVPSDFRPISAEALYNDNDDDDTSGRISHPNRSEREYHSKFTTGLSNLAAGYGLTPYGQAIFRNGVQTTDTTINGSPFDQRYQKDEAITLNSSTDLRQLMKAVEGKSTNKESKRDTLELIGIVGVISDEGDSLVHDSTTLASTGLAITTEDGDKTVTDQSLNLPVNGC